MKPPGRKAEDTRALLVVDVQRDFCPGGALPAPECDRILPAINAYLRDAAAQGLPIYASRDWHPEVTSHFKPYGGEWPPHCVQGSAGAEFHPLLQLPADTIIITKGEDPEHPGYSAFDGHAPDGRSFLSDLRTRHIDELFVAGLTIEYCVRQTVRDALRAGLRVIVLTDAIGGICARPGDVDRALSEMVQSGAILSTSLNASDHTPRFTPDV